MEGWAKTLLLPPPPLTLLPPLSTAKGTPPTVALVVESMEAARVGGIQAALAWRSGSAVERMGGRGERERRVEIRVENGSMCAREEES